MPVICGAAVARLSFWPELPVDVIDVAVRTPATWRGFRFSRREVPPEHCLQRGSVRTTSPAWAAIDLIGERGGEANDRERDRFRQNVLVRAGWTVLRFTLQQLEYDPEGVVAVVRMVLQQLERRQRSGRQRPADAG